MNFNELAKQIHEQNKAVGWWDNPDRCKLEALQLVSTEIAEATEAERKDLMDDHLPHRKGGEVELADALIRVLDMSRAYGWEYIDTGTSVAEFDRDFGGKPIASKHFALTVLTSSLGVALGDSGDEVDLGFSILVDLICRVAEMQGYDIESAMLEKLAYNTQRPDHKRENRAKADGKKF